MANPHIPAPLEIDPAQAVAVLAARMRLLHFADTQDLDQLLRATLDELETLTQSQIGFYHFLEADQQTLSLQAWSTRTLGGAVPGGRGRAPLSCGRGRCVGGLYPRKMPGDP